MITSLLLSAIALVLICIYQMKVKELNKMDTKQLIVTILASFVPILNLLIIVAIIYDLGDNRIRKGD